MFQGSCVALITPMTMGPLGESTVDWDAYDQLLDWHRLSGTQAVVIGGTTGESATLEPSEYERMLAHAVDQLKGKVLVIAGTGTSSTRQTVSKTQQAAQLGADAALVVTPAYNRPSQNGLMAHYLSVADGATVPIILYNVPSRTAVDLLPETAVALSQHPNIVGIKEAVPDEGRVRALVEAGMTVFSGDDPTFVRSMRLGAKGVISVASNIVPEVMAKLCQAVASGEDKTANELNARLTDLYAFLGVETNPVPAKWLLAQIGRCSDLLRLPLVSLDSKYHGQGQELVSEIRRLTS